MTDRTHFLGAALSIAALAAIPLGARAQGSVSTTSGKQYLKTEHGQGSAYSQAIVTAPGRTVWLAGQTGQHADDGKLIVDFLGQAKQIFHLFEQSLSQVGGKISDIVEMTVYLKDIRYADQLTTFRKAYFKDNFPTSAIIGTTALAQPEILLEIQATAVINS
jgi:2-iminobutanoate/2-iminopropanoate deaminase